MLKPTNWLLSCFSAVATILMCASTTAAQEPLCGLHAVYSAARLLGTEPRLAHILTPEFVGSQLGSSLAELEKAAAKLGLHSLSVGKLSTADLRHSTLPIILHVKTDLASSNYNHFVLFGGYRDGKAIIYDGTNEPMHWTLGEVASRWDGNALVLSRAPISLWALTAPSRWSLIAWGCAIAGVIGLSMLLQKRAVPVARGRLGRVWAEAAALGAVAGCAALVFHATSAEGFIAGKEGVRTIWGAHASSFLPRIDADEARTLARDGALFVDARSPREYASGHIDGAANLPATLSEAEAMRIARDLPRGRKLVVYCSNSLCHFSNTTAQRLLQAGHEDVVIFTGGWKDWEGKPDTPALED